MYGIYANIWGILMGSMLPYIAAPWILWVIYYWRVAGRFPIPQAIFSTTRRRWLRWPPTRGETSRSGWDAAGASWISARRDNPGDASMKWWKAPPKSWGKNVRSHGGARKWPCYFSHFTIFSWGKHGFLNGHSIGEHEVKNLGECYRMFMKVMEERMTSYWNHGGLGIPHDLRSPQWATQGCSVGFVWQKDIPAI